MKSGGGILRSLRKLRKMPASEVRGRVAERVRLRRERRAYASRAQAANRATGLIPASDGPNPSAASLLVRAQQFVPGSRSSEIEKLRHEHPVLHAKLAERALSRGEGVLSGAWTLFEFPVDLRGEIDWHCDPRTGTPFDRVFHADVPMHRDGGGVDIKYVWELGRQQYLVDLARSWLLHRRAVHAERARSILLDWIEQNPLYEGVHWTSGLEAAMRSTSWIWTLAGLAEWDGWRARDLERITRSLAEHAEYLRSHFSLYSSPYNHLIGEATGLLLIAAVMPGDPRASVWTDAARSILSEHGPQQFYADGYCVEQAMGYHFYTLGFLLLAVQAARQAGEPLADLEAVAQKACRTAMAFRMPNGRWPAIGDVDSARSIPVQPDEFWDFDGFCSAAAGLFDDSQCKLPEMEAGEELFWLLGADGVTQWRQLDAADSEVFRVLEDSGYVIGRRDGDWFCFDAGPIAHGLHPDATPSTAHGHLDTLQVLYCHNGRPVLVDSGMPFYFGDPTWVRHFRGAAAHNTLEIEWLPLAQDAGGLQWSHVTPRPQLEVGEVPDAWTCSAKLQLGKDCEVERSVLCVPGQGLWITDAITLDQPRDMRWRWQLGAPVERCQDNANPGVIARGDRFVLGIWAEGCSRNFTVMLPQQDSPNAWQASGYGLREPGCVVVEELRSVQTLMKVLFVGAVLVPFEITSRDRSVTGCSGLDSHAQVWRCGSWEWRIAKCASEVDASSIGLPQLHSAAGTRQTTGSSSRVMA